MLMGRRFVFTEEVRKALAEGRKELKLPEGTRLSQAAVDLIKEKGIHVVFDPPGADSSTSDTRPETKPDQGKISTESMRIAIASMGKTERDEVGDVAGRSPYFLIFDGRGELLEVLDNRFRTAQSGVGRHVADLLARKNVHALVAGNFGVKIRESLKNRDIDYLELSGYVGQTLRSALKHFHILPLRPASAG
jgi:predicted Fe-Mo cluster-binding NifX family protein